MAERSVTVRLRAVIDEYRRAMRQASSDADKTSKDIKGSFSSLGKEVGALGSTLTRQVTVPLVGAGVGALKLASDFETAFSQMVGLAGVAAEEVDGLKESLLELSQQTAVGPRELASALYEASSAGLETADALEAVQSAAKASAAGMGSTADLVGLAASAISAYGSDTVDAAKATDVLTAAVKEGRANPRELAGSLGVVLPIASQLGVTFEEVGGAVAFLSNTFGDTSRTTNSLRAMFANLLSPSEQGRKTLEEFGTSAEQLSAVIDNRGLLGAFELLRTSGIARSDVALRSLFSDVDGYTAALQLLNGDTAKLNQTFRNVANSAGALDKAFGQARQSDAFKLKQAWAELQVALIRIGSIIAPVAADIAGAIEKIAAVFGSLPDWAQTSVVALLGIAAATGPILRAGSNIATLFKTLQPIVSKALDSMAVGAYNAAGNLKTLGIVSAAAGLLITGLVMKFQDMERAAEQARIRQRALADAIRETGSVAGGVAGLLNAGLQASQEFAAGFAAAGVTVDEVAAALQAGGPAWDTMRQRLLAGGREAGLTGLKFELFRSVIDGLPNDAAKAQQHLDNLNKSGVKPVGDAATSAAGGVDVFAGALGNLDAQAAATAQQIDALLKTISGLWDSTFGLVDAQSAAADALADVESAARVTGGSSRNLEADQRNLERATRDVTRAQEELAEAEAALAEARRGPTARETSDAALDVREATLGVKEATRAQAEARKKLREEIEKGDEGDVAGARLNLESASIRLKRAQDRLTDAQAAQNKVMNSGKETSDEVKDALKAVRDAQDRLTDATERQNDAERQLRGEGATGGPVADRARNIAGALDRWRDAQKNVIDEMVKAQKPSGEIIAELNKQQIAAQKLIDTYGDPDGKLQRFIDNNQKLKDIFADAKFQEDARKIAEAVGVIVGPGGVIIDMGGGSSSFEGRAGGGPVVSGRTYVIGENRQPELFTPGASGFVTPLDKLGKMSSLLNSPMTAAPLAAPNIELHVHTHADADIVKFTNTFVRYSRQPGGLPIRIASDV